MAHSKNHKKAKANKQAESPEESARNEKRRQLMTRDTALTPEEAAFFHEEFPTIIAPYRERVLKRLLKGRLNRQDAEEARQEVFLALYKHVPAHGFPKNLPAWLTTITNEKLSKYSEAKKQAALSTCLPSSTSEKPRSYVDAEKALDRKTIARRAVKKLSQEHQDVIEMVIVKGLTHTEAAAALGLPEGTVKSRLLAAKSALDALLKAALPPSQR